MRTHRDVRDRLRVLFQTRFRKGAELLLAGDYTLTLPAFLRIHTPWYSSDFAACHSRVAARTTLPPERLYYLLGFARHAAALPADIAELGSYRGGSGRVLAEAAPDRQVHLFDTFQGMPAEVTRARDGHLPGDFGDTSVEQVRRYLSDLANVRLHPGTVPESLSAVAERRFSLVHCDIDTYQGTKDCLAFFYERMLPGGVILFDEYAMRAYEHAERAAVDEFFASRPERPMALASGQGFVIRQPSAVA